MKGCIGPGSSSSLSTGDYLYVLTDTPNISLACTPGQTWAISLLRTLKDHIPSWRSGWGYYSNNPLIVPAWPSVEQLCGVQYARLFEDKGEVYLIYEDFGPHHNFVERRLMRLETGQGGPLNLTTSVH